jgi:hypothetical protein
LRVLSIYFHENKKKQGVKNEKPNKDGNDEENSQKIHFSLSLFFLAHLLFALELIL